MTWDLMAASSREGVAATAVGAWAVLVRAVRSGAPGNRLDDARLAVASVLAPSQVRAQVRGQLPADRPVAAMRFAEQMTADVSMITEDQRLAALAELGTSALPFVQAVWVCDLGTRARHAFGELFGDEFLDDAMSEGELGVEEPAWPAQEQFLREVAKLTALDPVTSELVRLRGARAHGCRLCQSLRSRAAVQAAGGGELFDARNEEPDDLTERHAAAVALVDAFIWQPLAWPADLAARLRHQFSPAEAIELILDLMRNSANKIAVALAADAPHVSDGVEYYDIDFSSGELLYGLSPA
ncbi:MAG TPA: hypothetical protein VMO88_17615 [Acidimicrobiales bacterium]|nr:hypothetical protein [Acidimicrobiales bacterium]